MAEGKKSFLLYADYIDTFEDLSDEEAGQLIKHIFRYVNDKDPVTESRVTNITFGPIKRQMKRDLESWEGTKLKNAVNGSKGGKKSGEVRKKKALEAMYFEAVDKQMNEENEAALQVASKSEANEAGNVNVTVTDNVDVLNGAPLGLQMQQAFLKVNPQYAQAPGQDMMAIVDIALFLHQQCGGKKKRIVELDVGERMAVLDEWVSWCHWYSIHGNNKDLGYLERFKKQSIFMDIKNHKKETEKVKINLK